MEDIKPIDKFTLDKYVKEEEDLLEYVEMLGCKCHPDWDFDKERNYVFMGTTVTQEFKKRYNERILEVPYNFEK